MSELERSYRRALRAYPRQWRRANGEVLLSTLLDAADAQGRDSPAPRELGSLFGYGMGERLNRRSALVLAIAAVVLGAAGTIMAIGFQLNTVALPYLLMAGVAPFLSSAAVAGVLREVGSISHLRALLCTALSLPAWILCALAWWSWAVGFEQADQGVPLSPLASAFGVLFVVSWAFGAATCALALSEVLRASPLVPALRVLLSVVLGCIIAPVLAFTASTAYGSTIFALAVLICVLLLGRASSRSTSPVPVPAPPRAAIRPLTPVQSGRISSAAWFAIALGLPAVAYALTGSLWFAPGPDSTETMRLGMSLGLLASIPLVLLAGRALEARRGTPGPWIGSPALGVALLLLIAAAASGLLLSDSIQWYLLILSVGVGVYTCARAAYLALTGTLGYRLLLSCAIGGGYLLGPGFMVSTAGAFAAPLLGAAALLWLRRASAHQPAPVRV